MTRSIIGDDPYVDLLLATSEREAPASKYGLAVVPIRQFMTLERDRDELRLPC